MGLKVGLKIGLKTTCCFVFVLLLVSCSAEDSSKDDHVFKTQENALDSAKDVQSKMDAQAKKTKEKIQQQTQ